MYKLTGVDFPRHVQTELYKLGTTQPHGELTLKMENDTINEKRMKFQMRKTRLKIVLALLILFSLVLASCGSAPKETAPEGEIELDGDWMHDDTPPYSYAQAMRDRLDPILDEAFGISAVHYYVRELIKVHGQGIYNVRYVLEEVPQGKAFYYALDDVFNQTFDFYLFADMESAETYFEHHDEPPDDVFVSMNFEGLGYNWEVRYDGTYLSFFTL